MKASVPSVGRWYSHDMSPSAKKFFERSASREVMPSIPFSASTVIDVSATACTWKSASEPSSSGLDGVPRLLQVAVVEGVAVDDQRAALRQVADVRAAAPPGSSPRARSGWSPGVRMSWSAKWTWKPETPGSEPAGARISAGKSGKRREVVPENGRLAREAIARELHAVAGVACEADDHAIELLDRLAHGLTVATLVTCYRLNRRTRSRLSPQMPGPRIAPRPHLTSQPGWTALGPAGAGLRRGPTHDAVA